MLSIGLEIPLEERKFKIQNASFVCCIIPLLSAFLKPITQQVFSLYQHKSRHTHSVRFCDTPFELVLSWHSNSHETVNLLQWHPLASQLSTNIYRPQALRSNGCQYWHYFQSKIRTTEAYHAITKVEIYILSRVRSFVF